MKSMNVLRVRASVKDGRNKEWLVRSCGFILDSNQKDAWLNSPCQNSDKFKKPKPGNGTAHSAALHVATPFEIHGTVKAGLTRQSKRGAILKWRLHNFRDFGPPPPPCLHFGKINKTKSTQPPLLRLHFVNPPSPPQCTRHLSMAPMISI